MISYGRQSIGNDDIKAVVKVLKSSNLTQGKEIEKFEKLLARYVGSKYCVAFNNGTSALFAACHAAGIGSGDEVIVPTLSFVASANCVGYCGGKPVLVDVNPKDNTIDIQLIRKSITKNTKAIIAVDFAGHTCNWDELRKIARKFKLLLISDASHALGSKYKGARVGTIAQMTTFSFHPVKAITTGEGGAVTTNSKVFRDKMRQFRNHGILKKASWKNRQGMWFYDVSDIGFNLRLTDLQAALGISQLRKLKSFIKKRRVLWQRYNVLLSNYQYFQLPQEQPWSYSAWHLYTLRLKSPYFNQKRVIFDNLLANGIKGQVHYRPIHMHSFYKKKGLSTSSSFPAADEYYKQEISLPLYPDLTFLEQNKVVKALIKSLKANE